MNTKELSGKFQNCFEDESGLERELVLKREETGEVLVKAVLLHLDADTLGQCLDESLKFDSVKVLLAGVKSFSVTGEEGKMTDVPVTEENIRKLSRSRFVGGVLRAGVFDALATEVMGLNVLSEGEAKNS